MRGGECWGWLKGGGCDTCGCSVFGTWDESRCCHAGMVGDSCGCCEAGECSSKSCAGDEGVPGVPVKHQESVFSLFLIPV